MADAGFLNLVATSLVLSAMLAFARIGTVIILVPGFGDARISARIRIALGVIVSLALLPAVPKTIVPDQPALLASLIAFEVTVGLFLATAVRLFLSTVHVLGAQISYSAGLANSISPNDGNFESASSLSSLVYMGAIAFMFATDTHHLILKGILLSYDAIPVGTLPVIDMAQQIARISADVFYIALSIGAPFLVFSILFNLALGLANKVMPAMQVFFVASPAMIIIGIGILAIAVGMILHTVNEELSNWLQDLVR